MGIRSSNVATQGKISSIHRGLESNAGRRPTFPVILSSHSESATAAVEKEGRWEKGVDRHKLGKVGCLLTRGRP